MGGDVEVKTGRARGPSVRALSHANVLGKRAGHASEPVKTRA